MKKASNTSARAAVWSLVVVMFACGPADGPGEDPGSSASLVLHGGHVITMADSADEATAIAVQGDRIVYVGDDAGALDMAGEDTRVIDLRGATALPGLTDAHGHLMGTGRLKQRVNVLGTTTYQALIDAVADAVAEAEPGDWIVGRGWHQDKWTDAPPASVRGFPTNDDLTRIAPENPVSIRHASGHGRLVNRLALEAAGVDASTADPAGGEILHDSAGRPTGMLLEEAEDLVEDAYQAWLARRDPAEVLAADRAALRAGIQELLANGITQVHSPPASSDPGVSALENRLFRDALRDGELHVRVYAMVNGPEVTADMLDEFRLVDDEEPWLTVRAIKAYADGALGSRGAMLLQPYRDDGSSGQEVRPVAELERIIRLGLEHDYQVAIHAIGDAANRRVLDLYEAAFAARPEDVADARFRIEHAQILHPEDVSRFAELGVIASMQGVHATSDGPWTADRLGEFRTSLEAFPFLPLWETGATIVNGTDTPVERVDPWASIHGMTVGEMNNGSVFNPHHLLSRRQALATYTVNPAYAAFQEDLRGTLETGKLADITVVDRDPLTVPGDELAATETLWTIVGGDVKYEAGR